MLDYTTVSLESCTLLRIHNTQGLSFNSKYQYILIVLVKWSYVSEICKKYSMILFKRNTIDYIDDIIDIM